MSSFIRKVLPIGLSIAAPGVGTALGTALGAGAAWAPTVGNALIGAGIGGIGKGGGLKNALIGGLGAGVGSALSSGLAGNGINSILNSGAGSIADTYGTSGELGGVLNSLKASATQGGGGFAGTSLGKALSSGASAISPTSSGGLSTSNAVSQGLSAYNDYNAADEQEKKLLAAQGRIEDVLSPYTSAGESGLSAIQAGFDPSQITSDAGYQFRLQQGQDALNKALAAQGMSGSGAAIKAASDYSQGQASQAYNDAWNQWYRQNAGLVSAGQGAVGQMGDVYDTMGDVQANALTTKRNTINELLANILRGNA